MRHEKILKRSNGSRVRISVEFTAEWNGKAEWSFTVHVCEKGKRTWIAPCDSESYLFRKLSATEKLQAIRAESLRRATPQEIESVMLELWEKLKPSV